MDTTVAQASAAQRHQSLAGLVGGLAQALAPALARRVDFERVAARIALRNVRPRELAALRDAGQCVHEISGLLAPQYRAAVAEVLAEFNQRTGAVAPSAAASAFAKLGNACAAHARSTRSVSAALHTEGRCAFALTTMRSALVRSAVAST